MIKKSALLKVFFTVIFLTAASASGLAHQLPDGAEKLTKSEDCSGCHAAIYSEWKDSMHANSSPFKDNAHGAVRSKFAASLEQMGKTPSYHCGNCHTPMADNLAALMSGKSLPDSKNWTQNEGTGCSFCHRIESVIPGKEFNEYQLNKDGSFNSPDPSGKAPHKTKKSPLFASGAVCMGCHGHMLNAKGVPICVMNDEGTSNCITCHMTETEGAPAIGSRKKTHFSHSLPGGHDIEMLRKAVSLDIKVDTAATSDKKVVVKLKNISGHTFPSTMPMRIAFLKLTAEDANGKVVWSNIKESPTEDMQSLLVKMFKAGEEKGVPPWKAEAVAMDTRLKKGEERQLIYPIPGNVKTISVSLIYRLFAPPAMKMMEIPADGKNDKNYIVIKKKIDL